MLIKPNSNWVKAAWQIPAIFLIAGFVGLFGNYFRADPMPLKSDWSIQTRKISAGGKRLDISLTEAKKLFAGKKAVFIDARSAKAYASGHIAGARSLPWHDVDQRFMGATEDLAADAMIITYCDGETCDLSHELALFLIDMGFNNVKVLVNGWTMWLESHLPVEKGNAVLDEG